MTGQRQPKYEIEVFPKIDSYHWGLASSGTLSDETKAECTFWSVDVRFSAQEKAEIHAYYHGIPPSVEDRISLNQQIAAFFYGSVAAYNDKD
jgi:hypothetical protein